VSLRYYGLADLIYGPHEDHARETMDDNEHDRGLVTMIARPGNTAVAIYRLSCIFITMMMLNHDVDNGSRSWQGEEFISH